MSLFPPFRTFCVSVAIAIALTLQLSVGGCATPARLSAVPSDSTARAETVIPNVRFFPDRDPEPFIREAQASLEKEQAWLRQTGHAGPLPPVSFLLVSGGGGDGAFGAGLLKGWTEAGTRPEFKLVTGISTGALIAPFAFLGSAYDDRLTETYTSVSDEDIFRKRDFTAAFFSDAMADTAPLAGLVEQYVTRELLDAIAAEYAKGRLLVVGTTNLDAREAVYWNMGAIASSSDPAALNLFRQIVRASASIPGAFPPVMIDVTVDGQPYQEMHVDGGATRQVFLYPQTVQLGDLARAENASRKRSLYILRNMRLDPDWASVDRRTMSIVGRAVVSLIQTQGLGDLNRIYMTSARDGIDYNLAYIPADFTVVKTSEFDREYMSQLFARGRAMAAAGYVWDKYPPGFEPSPGAS